MKAHACIKEHACTLMHALRSTHARSCVQGSMNEQPDAQLHGLVQSDWAYVHSAPFNRLMPVSVIVPELLIIQPLLR